MDSVNKLKLLDKLSCTAVNSRAELIALETSMQRRARRLELVKKENSGLHNKDDFQRYITLSVFWNTLEAVDGRGY